MEGEVVDPLAGVNPASLPLREELLYHHDRANAVAVHLGRAISCVPGFPGAGVEAKVLMPEFGVAAIAETFWGSIERIASLAEDWPEVSNLAAIAFAAGASSANTGASYGDSASLIVHLGQMAARFGRFHQSFLMAEEQHGQPAEEYVAEHLQECQEDYATSRLAEWFEGVSPVHFFGAIDNEAAAALTWAEKHLSPYYSLAPESPRTVRQSGDSDTLQRWTIEEVPKDCRNLCDDSGEPCTVEWACTRFGNITGPGISKAGIKPAGKVGRKYVYRYRDITDFVDRKGDDGGLAV